MLHQIVAAVAAPLVVIDITSSGAPVLVAANNAFNALVDLSAAELAGRAEPYLSRPLLDAVRRSTSTSLPCEVDVLLGVCPEMFRASVQPSLNSSSNLVVVALGRVADNEFQDDRAPRPLPPGAELACRWQADGKIVYGNEPFVHHYHRSLGQILGDNLFCLLRTADIARVLANVVGLTPTAPSSACEHRRDDGSGGESWVERVDHACFDESGGLVGVLSFERDITDRRLAERRLADVEQRLALTLEAGKFGLWESDLISERVRFEPAYLRRHGWSAEQCELDLAEVRRRIHPRDRGRVRATYSQYQRGQQPQVQLEYRVRRRDGSYAWIEEHAMISERDQHGRPLRLVGVSTDVSARKQAEQHLAHLALHDPLTGLPNRRALAEALDRAVARAQRSGLALAVLALDLDGFKAINDRHGHPAGDVALVEVGARLRRTVRRSDVVARLGGDEFAVIAGELKGPHPVVRLARRIRSALAEPVPLPSGRARIGVSIGVAFYPVDGETPALLLSRADHALYAAKREGVGCRFCAELPEPTIVG